MQIFNFIDPKKFPSEGSSGLAMATCLEGPKQLVTVLIEAIDMGLDHPMTPVVTQVDHRPITDRCNE
jgi:hypothetical protein